MKKIILLFLIIIMLCKISFAQVPDWLWAKSAKGESFDNATSVAVDVSGNIYVAGYFDSHHITFESIILTHNGYNDVLLVKYDTNGNVLWAKSAGGEYFDNATSVSVDNSGNVYLSGNFASHTINFGTITLKNTDTINNTADIFFVKYDTDGNVVWAKSAGEKFDDYATSTSVDATGNIYLTGYYQGTNFIFGFDTLNNVNWALKDIFLVKYNANGNILWAKTFGGKEDDYVKSISVDAVGNISLAGTFDSPSIVFGSDTLMGNRYTSSFVVKYDIKGNAIWAKNPGNIRAYATAIDASGNIYLAGGFANSIITFDSVSLTNIGDEDIFLVKYNSNGNILWAKSAGGSGWDNLHKVIIDAKGNLYMTGFFKSSTITFGTKTLTNVGDEDIFLAEYDSNGNALWTKSVGGTNVDDANSIAVDALGNVYLVGKFMSSTISFGNTSLMNTIKGSNITDLFIAKIGSNGTGIK